MPKRTLLDMTQHILSDMSSDNVNSITDTEESAQVASIIQDTYYLLFSNREIPELEKLIQLDALADTAHPNYLKFPSSVDRVDWIKYDYATNGDIDYKPVYWLCPEDFITRQKLGHTEDDVVTITDFSGARYPIRTDTNPRYWTSFDDVYVVFDSYDDTLDTTLQSSKSLCWGQVEDTWTADDDFIPNIDANLFPMLLSEAASACFAKLKSEPSRKDEQDSRKQLIATQNNLWKNKDTNNRTGPNYGRRRTYATRSY